MYPTKENQTQSTNYLIEEFRRKGYQCQEMKQEEATIFILTHDKKTNRSEVQTENPSRIFTRVR